MASNSAYLSEAYQSPYWVAHHDTEHRTRKVGADNGVEMGNDDLEIGKYNDGWPVQMQLTVCSPSLTTIARCRTMRFIIALKRWYSTMVEHRDSVLKHFISNAVSSRRENWNKMRKEHALRKQSALEGKCSVCAGVQEFSYRGTNPFLPNLPPTSIKYYPSHCMLWVSQIYCTNQSNNHSLFAIAATANRNRVGFSITARLHGIDEVGGVLKYLRREILIIFDYLMKSAKERCHDMKLVRSF